MPEKTILRVVTVLQRLKLGGCPTRRYLRVRSPRQPVRGLTTVGRRPTRDQRRNWTPSPPHVLCPRLAAGRRAISGVVEHVRREWWRGEMVVDSPAGIGVERLPAL